MVAKLRPKQDLLKRKGSLSSPNPKPCHVLATYTEAADHVWIYKCDESKSVGCCLVKRLFLSNKEGKWVHIQKRHWATSERFISYLRKVSYSECWLLQVCRTLSKAMCFSWGKWYICSVCLHNPPRCQANDVGWKNCRPHSKWWHSTEIIWSLSATGCVQSITTCLLPRNLWFMSRDIWTQGTPQLPNGWLPEWQCNLKAVG